MQREPSGGLERDLDPMVEEGAPLDQRALGRRPGTAGRGRTDRQTRAGQPQPWHARRAERDAHLVHLVLVRVVVRRVEPLRPDASVEHLHGNRVAVRGDEGKRPVALSVPRDALPGRTFTGRG